MRTRSLHDVASVRSAGPTRGGGRHRVSFL